MNDNAPDQESRDRQYVLLGFAGVVYFFGWLLDWAYWTYTEGAVGVVFGWLPALFWPLHALSTFWGLVL